MTVDARMWEGHASLVHMLEARVNEIASGEGVRFDCSMRSHEAEGELVQFVCRDDIQPGQIKANEDGFLVGVGKKPGEMTARDVMDLMGAIVKHAEANLVDKLSIELPAWMNPKYAAQGLQEALLKPGEFKTKKPTYKGLTDIELFREDLEEGELVVEFGLGLARAANIMRWLGLMPTNVVGMHSFPMLVERYFSGRGEGVRWMAEPTQEQYTRMGLLNGVAQGSEQPGRVMTVRIDPIDGPTPALAIVGKGVVYDSGGLNLKPKGGIGMKYDMGGAAAAFAVADWAIRNRERLKHSLVVTWAFVENCIGPKAYRPGDVLWGYNGKTVEVNNCDAEGRFILADGAAYTCEVFEDIATVMFLCTLTGAGAVATGEQTTAVNLRIPEGDEVDWAAKLTKLGRQIGDPVGVLPATGDTAVALKSQIADMANVGSAPWAGSPVGAAFLWAHLPDKMDAVEMDIGGRVSTDTKGVCNPAGVYLPIQMLLTNNYK